RADRAVAGRSANRDPNSTPCSRPSEYPAPAKRLETHFESRAKQRARRRPPALSGPTRRIDHKRGAVPRDTFRPRSVVRRWADENPSRPPSPRLPRSAHSAFPNQPLESLEKREAGRVQAKSANHQDALALLSGVKFQPRPIDWLA